MANYPKQHLGHRYSGTTDFRGLVEGVVLGKEGWMLARKRVGRKALGADNAED